MDALRKLLVAAVLGGGGYGYYYTQTKSGGERPLGVGSFSERPRGTSSAGSMSSFGENTETIRSQGLDQIFRFDKKPGWVIGNWQRVTTGLSDVHLQGYRVVLVNGTRESDLAGSLTYYFDNLQRMRRIVFSGGTGDYRPLVVFLEKEYGFRRQITPEARVVTYSVPRPRFRLLPARRATRPPVSYSRLQITPAPVVSHQNPNGRFGIELVLERKLQDLQARRDPFPVQRAARLP